MKNFIKSIVDYIKSIFDDYTVDDHGNEVPK